MRRFMIILSFCMLLSGCSRLPDQEEDTKPAKKVLLPDSGPGMWGDVLHKYDVYLDYIADDTKIPVHFVYYEQIASLGQFQQCNNETWVNNEGKLVGTYDYTLKDEFNRYFHFEGRGYTSDNNYEEAEGVNPEDMRSVSGGYIGTLKYVSDNLVYIYDASSGKLQEIYWEVDGVDFGFRIRAYDGFSSFEPDPEGTIVDRLLHLDSAPAALDELVDMISTPYFP